MSTIKQVSVFIENKSGRLNEIMEIISKADVRIIAASVADTSEFGIFRIISSDPDKIVSVLKDHDISTQLCEVFAIAVDPKAGSFLNSLKPFAENGISVEYMYCFSTKECAVAITRTSNNFLAEGLTARLGIRTLSNEELNSL